MVASVAYSAVPGCLVRGCERLVLSGAAADAPRLPGRVRAAVREATHHTRLARPVA